MKRYQLIGRKKKDMRVKVPGYPPLHIHSLPLEIFTKILNFIDDIPVLISVSLTCRKFHSIVVKNYLYKSITFVDIDKFLLFTRIHLPSKRYGITDSSTAVNLIQSVEFVNPPIKNSNNFKTKIAGTYDVESVSEGDGRKAFEEFEDGFLSLLKHNYNLKQITISEISPQFLFNDMVEESLMKRYRKRVFRSMNKVVLKAQTGWSILFMLDHISKILDSFDTIYALELHNFIIDESMLLEITVSKEVRIEKLTLVSCVFQNRSSKSKPCELFKYTNSLVVVDLLQTNDLSVIDFIKRNNGLSSISVDLGSAIFYSKNQFNYKVFNPFFKLLCSKNGFYANLGRLELVNIDLFTHDDDHDHDPFRDGEKETINDLLEHVSKVPQLAMVVKYTPTLRMCKKCGIIQSENMTLESITKRDWQIILKPLVDNNTKFKIYNCSYKLLYEVT